MRKFDPTNLPDGDYDTGGTVVELDTPAPVLPQWNWKRQQWDERVNFKIVSLIVIVRKGKIVGRRLSDGRTYMFPAPEGEMMDLPPLSPDMDER